MVIMFEMVSEKTLEVRISFESASPRTSRTPLPIGEIIETLGCLTKRTRVLRVAPALLATAACEPKNRVSLLKIVFLNTFRVILVFPVRECSSLAKTLEQGTV